MNKVHPLLADSIFWCENDLSLVQIWDSKLLDQ